MFITDSSVWFEMADDFIRGTLDANFSVWSALRNNLEVKERLQLAHDLDMAYLAM